MPLRYLPSLRPALLALAFGLAGPQAWGDSRHVFADAIRAPDPTRGAQIVRRSLSAEELSARMPLALTLQLRNADDLRARLAQGQTLSPAQMEAQYLPLAADYQAVRNWALSQGLTIDFEDPSHAAVFASGTVAQVQAALDTTFARVATAEGEFTSAITAPSLPAEIAGRVMGISGLQPHIRRHHNSIGLGQVVTVSTSGGASLAVAPSDLQAAYKVPGNLTGAGQTLAVMMAATVLTSDLASFYSTVGSSQNVSNITTVTVAGGPTRSSQSENATEAALDVEWASAMAPGARVRLYAIPGLDDVSMEEACAQILADASGNNITVLSMSFGGAESADSPGNLQTLDTYFMRLAAAGITSFAASGDGGSNPNPNTGDYSSRSPLSVDTPADDPFVMGVGGTMVTFSGASYSYSGEVVWNDLNTSTPDASGGGISTVFARPSWQSASGTWMNGAGAQQNLASQSFRCVPDVSAFSVGNNLYAVVIQNGQANLFGGTSLATPVWAGITACLNQARAAASESPFGNLGPYIYPLQGSGFNDITSGNNGYYYAAAGYDLCTGLGSPITTALESSLVPEITSSASASGTVGTAFSYSITANDSPTSFSLVSGSLPPGLSLNTSTGVISGTPTSAGTYVETIGASNGSVTATGSLTIAINSPSTSSASPPPASSGGGGGGGGAPSLWFYAALALASALRVGLRPRRDPA